MIKKRTKMNYRDAILFLAKNIAVLQLYPYHSKKFRIPKRIRKELESTNLIRKFVKEVLVKEAKSGKTLIIVARGAKKWGIDKISKNSDNIIVLKNARGASFGKKSKVAERIVEFLLKKGKENENFL